MYYFSLFDIEGTHVLSSRTGPLEYLQDTTSQSNLNSKLVSPRWYLIKPNSTLFGKHCVPFQGAAAVRTTQIWVNRSAKHITGGSHCEVLYSWSACSCPPYSTSQGNESDHELL